MFACLFPSPYSSFLPFNWLIFVCLVFFSHRKLSFKFVKLIWKPFWSLPDRHWWEINPLLPPPQFDEAVRNPTSELIDWIWFTTVNLRASIKAERDCLIQWNQHPMDQLEIWLWNGSNFFCLCGTDTCLKFVYRSELYYRSDWLCV